MKRAFTLTEMLAALAVCSLLGTAALGVTARLSDRGNAVRCVGNLRQWGIAMQGYVQDNGGFLPRRGQGVQPVSRVERPEDWFNALTPYLEMPSFNELVTSGSVPKPGERSVFVCPSARAGRNGGHFITYGMNMYLSRWDQPERTRVAALPDPGTLAFMADAPGGYASTVPSRAAFSVEPRHGGRANVLFLDGRVQAFDGAYLGCGEGDKTQPDVRWCTGIPGDTWVPNS